MKVKLSPYQAKVVTDFQLLKHNMGLFASAGSGKTFIIIYLAKLVPRRVKSGFFAFNSHIVVHLNAKLPDHIQAFTINSHGNRACREFLGRNLSPDKYKYANKIRTVVEQHPEMGALNYTQKREIQTCLRRLVDMARNTCTDTSSVDALIDMSLRYNIEVKDFKLYEMVDQIIQWGIETFKAGVSMDFTDQLYMPYRLGLKMEKYDLIMLDEAQDFNKLQHELIKMSCNPDTRVIFVGDEMQSMYGFTGALLDSLQLLKAELNAKVYTLPVCYRCPASHIRIAQHFDLGRTIPREDAPEGKVEYILQSEIYNRVSAGDLILCRLTAPLIGACIRLIAKNVPAKVLGREIGDQLVALVEACMQRQDVDDQPDWSAFPARLLKYVNELKEKMAKQPNNESLIDLLTDKYDCIKTCYTSDQFQITTQATFCGAIKALFDDSKSPITLCTVHKAKGLEANNVFIIADKNGRNLFPLLRDKQMQWELDQEINIGYVAFTRAKQNLFICASSEEKKSSHKEFFESGAIRGYVKRKLLTDDAEPVDLTISVTEIENLSPPPEPEITVRKLSILTDDDDEPEIAPVKRKKKKKKKKKNEKSILLDVEETKVTKPIYMQMDLFPRKFKKKKPLIGKRL